jgi:hypothetical protein
MTREEEARFISERFNIIRLQWAVAEQFLENIPTYEIVEGVYLSQWDFRQGKELKSNDIWCVLINRNGESIQTLFSNEIMKDILLARETVNEAIIEFETKYKLLNK